MGPFLAIHSTYDDVDDRTVVEVGGEIDLATAPRLHAHLARLLDGATGPVTLDLGAVTFMDARGLAALVAIRTHADTAMIPVRLTALPPLVERLLRLTGLENLFTIETGPEHQPATPKPSARERPAA
ncbi:STAS domain-containing protein [Sphaerisporangium sp. TRM90804]|uniref:STAS domain-containing protein n=1 Tax=Sphaerisporangium sp. TRM90804 TaxID=3031113 RepID=UPI00244920A6|nr:STAS domain-containing protein [Sphaerisporangium sp. TRM90804]MDH2424226.1 STAS domain-containing protein [Sphaerisporangium sp. TRM90804]